MMSLALLALRFAILLLNLAPFLCLLYTVVAPFQTAFPLDRQCLSPLLAYTLSESLFLALRLIQYRYTRDQPAPPTPSAEARARFWKDAMRAVTSRQGVDDWLEGWFIPVGKGGVIYLALEWLGVSGSHSENAAVPMKDIKRGNIEELLSGTFFHLPLKAVLANPTQHHALISLLLALEAKRNHRFQSGYNPSIKPLCLSLRQVPFTHRPLALYAAISLVNSLAGWILHVAGFKRFEAREGRKLAYLYHPGLANPGAGLPSFFASRLLRSTCAERNPMIVLHGLGGSAPLAHFILGLVTLNRPVFILDQPHISFSLTLQGAPPPSMSDMVTSVHSMLAEQGFDGDAKGTIVAHSLGTALAAALAHHSSSSEFEAILIDPVSILMHNPHLVRSFVTTPRSIMAALVRYFVEEPGMARYIFREFSAFDGDLALSSSGSNSRCTTRVVLGRNDHLIPVHDIVRHCKSAGVEVDVLENTEHGGFLWSLPVFLQVLDVIKRSPLQRQQVIESDTPKVIIISSDITRARSRTLCEPGVPPRAGNGRIGRGRSRTLGGVGMSPCKSLSSRMVDETTAWQRITRLRSDQW